MMSILKIMTFPLKMDMHVHSLYSDGDLMPDHLLSFLLAAGLRELTLTDHVVLNAQPIMEELCRKKGLKYHTGVEFYMEHEKIDFHILAYDFNIIELERRIGEFIDESKVLCAAKALSTIRRSQDEPFTFFYKAKEHSIFYTNADLAAAGKGISNMSGLLGAVGARKLHEITGFLLDQCAATNIIDRKNAKYLEHYRQLLEGFGIDVECLIEIGRKTPNHWRDYRHLNIQYPSSKELFDGIHAAGGWASLAHPGDLNLDDKLAEEFIAYLRMNGLDGLEAYCPKNNSRSELYLRIAHTLGLRITGGTDWHGPHSSPGIKIGECKGLQIGDFVKWGI